MIRLLTLAVTLALAPAAASAERWMLHKRPSAAPGAGECALSALGENGARIELTMRDANRRKSDFRLVLWLAPGSRATIPVADGETFLSFASSGQKSTPLTGKLRGTGKRGIFSHDFPSLDAMRAFVTETARGPVLYVAGPHATPHTELLARFHVSEGTRAMNALLSCNFPIR
ncbi:hypothetical protein FHY55_10090 [Oceanicola sp. D3]|uniref:hypothetical protein n=1 Tax=Oceanicola sp. D3 TaxID=2587163 RepID=UPI00112395C6|nr:hypothetical protein [Oceanicola sp. D3]QDC09570.1 hypothetical protein FHY55_10090 [Oceanicola sp. D3]